MERYLPRWIQVPFGLVLGVVVLLCLAGSLALVFFPKGQAPVLTLSLGVLLSLLSLWLLGKCFRLILGGKTQRGFMGPTALRVIAWFFLLLPLGGLWNGYFQEHPILALVQTAAYVSIFQGLRSRAAYRERAWEGSGRVRDPSDPDRSLPL